jgi:hypothetical protein
MMKFRGELADVDVTVPAAGTPQEHGNRFAEGGHREFYPLPEFHETDGGCR